MKVTELFETNHDLKKLADEFVEEYEGEVGDDRFGCSLKELHDEGGNCSMISNEFQNWLKKKGIASKDIQGEDPTNEKWNDGDKGFYPSDDPPPDIASHVATLVGDTVIDFNARQFDKKLEYPRLITKAQFQREWKKVKIS